MAAAGEAPSTGRLRGWLPFVAGLLVTTVYGLVTYAIMRLELFPQSAGVMSLTFLFSLPVAIGATSVALAPPDRRGSTRYLLVAPWVACLLVGITPLFFAWEAIICVVMALPIFLPLTSLGAVAAWLVCGRSSSQLSRQSPALLLVLLPYLTSPIEAQFTAPDSVHVVHNSVTIEAPPAAVWRQIVRVPAIGKEEQHFSVLHLIGLPRPVEATLSREGVGAVRHASFERGLLFVETVDEWQDQRAIGFSIVRDQGSVPPAPLEAIGGPLFDMLNGRYEIEPISDRRVILHLTSTHRLSTHFNWYAGLWTEPIMSELQQYILSIVKARSQLPA
jgi:hypothetical protein